MNANSHIDADELALFAMQLLEPDEQQQVLLHLQHCDRCRRELGGIQGDLALFSMTAEVHSPPALARERLLTQVRRERRTPPKAQGATLAERRDGSGEATARSTPQTLGRTERTSVVARRKSADAGTARPLLSRALPWAGWVIAAGLAVMAGNLMHQRELLRGTVAAQAGTIGHLHADAVTAHAVLDTLTDRAAMHVLLTRTKQAPEPTGRATYVPETGALVFEASNLEQLGPYKTYELWLIPADGHDPVPAGTFVPDPEGNASVMLPSLPKGVAAKAFGVTIEDEGGAQTPTMPIILAGT